ncbi:MAG: S-layer homology domain-containing protein [Oscillospiraceae bacterium]|nr:S-layer homology domain-containing protein [Oscillospiraceae bacterium]
MKKLLIPSALLLSLALLATLMAPVLAAPGVGAPVAENLSLETYRGVSVGGRLSGTDPDGDALRFEIATPPSKGSVDLGEDGRFVYTPDSGRRGRDYFGYRAIDPDGNASQEATVVIKILKQKTKVEYADTAGTAGAYAAVRLAEEGLFTGANLAGSYVFEPERAVTREEFLTMCVRMSGLPVLSGAVVTGFSDNADIEVWARPYVGAALRGGVISGAAGETGKAVFEPDRPVTVLEAVVILDRAIGLTDAVTTWFSWDDAVPAWAMQSAANAASCGLMPAGVRFSDETLSRGDAAQMLSAAMDLLAKR